MDAQKNTWLKTHISLKESLFWYDKHFQIASAKSFVFSGPKFALGYICVYG